MANMKRRIKRKEGKIKELKVVKAENREWRYLKLDVPFEKARVGSV